ncbi:MAG: hypothetical protein PHP43_06530, partial [Methanoculleus sp.]|nr:hypothetical protein [Methanoculleus sp.]
MKGAEREVPGLQAGDESGAPFPIHFRPAGITSISSSNVFTASMLLSYKYRAYPGATTETRLHSALDTC